ncbi:hypothetical protein [Leptolyngbya sp. NIES-2104]|uniref:hypothetical protein n=1 Tax=Leptolyngbya sp. NIES-2104 TaxID=1552121 RepID=UPI0006EC76A2|nr:hypothetical protein [Leptolyngbya sp. NIES-2104]GAP94035.1 hypothetical protein NIES2104_05450 [Leptolyngbya sp. NIES-2104]
MQTSQAIVINLEMSDIEYLELLAQGRNPIQEQSYRQQLIGFGFDLTEAKDLAPLFDQKEASIAEKIAVNRALKQVWNRLIKMA